MLIGGITAFILDNAIPGSRVERGMTVWRRSTEDTGTRVHVYDLPFGLKKLSTYKFAKYTPFLPYYTDDNKNDAAVELRNVVTSVPDSGETITG